MLGATPYIPLAPEWLYPLRTLLVVAVIAAVSRGVVKLRPARPFESVAAGIVVFVIWVGPEYLWPGYHGHWLFQNAVTGAGPSTLPAAAFHNPVFLIFRAAGSALVVPVAEELFWRGWLMRRFIAPDFSRVPLGAFTAGSFAATALLFASEHGPYWDVGLAAGLLYNAWMVRTRSLADCILAHAVTNACLAAYVLARGDWQYWL
jgi:CAAX prenyl protease-like protein